MARHLVPNRLPRLPRSVLKEITQEVSDRVMAAAKVAAAHLPGTATVDDAFGDRQRGRICYLNWDNQLFVFALSTVPEKYALGSLVFSGRCFHSRVTEGRRTDTQVQVQLDFDGRHPLSEIVEPGDWQVGLLGR